MVDAGIGGGNAHSGGFSAGTLFSDGVGLPTGRAMANGDIACLVVAVGAYLGGRGGSPVGSLSYAGQTSGAFGLPNIGTPTSGTSPLVGPVGIPNFLSRGGSTRLQWNGPSSGPAYPGRGGGGSVNGPAGWSRAGTMGGVVRYAQAPVAPSMLSATSSADGTQCTTSFSWAGDDGGAGLLAYRLQRADDAGFTVNVATITVGGGGNTMTGLTPGKRYYWRAAAINSVTESAGALGGPWSNTVTNVQNQPALGRINLSGGGFALLKGRINPAGAGWVPLDMKVNVDGTGWKNSGY